MSYLSHSTTSYLIFFSVENRAALLMQHKICIYCVKHKYDPLNKCRLRYQLKCQKCGDSHITQMYPENKNLTRTKLIENQSDSLSEIILSTAIANIDGFNNELTSVSCLIDQGSQSRYITEDIV